jgi:hypothetical protein
MTWTAQKIKIDELGGHRQQGDLISLLSTVRVDTQTDGQTQSDTQTAR